jgi:hypothetical protein
MSSIHPYNSSSFFNARLYVLSFVSTSRQYGLRSVRVILVISWRKIKVAAPQVVYIQSICTSERAHEVRIR